MSRNARIWEWRTKELLLAVHEKDHQLLQKCKILHVQTNVFCVPRWWLRAVNRLWMSWKPSRSWKVILGGGVGGFDDSSYDLIQNLSDSFTSLLTGFLRTLKLYRDHLSKTRWFTYLLTYALHLTAFPVASTYFRVCHFAALEITKISVVWLCRVTFNRLLKDLNYVTTCALEGT